MKRKLTVPVVLDHSVVQRRRQGLNPHPLFMYGKNFLNYLIDETKLKENVTKAQTFQKFFPANIEDDLKILCSKSN